MMREWIKTFCKFCDKELEDYKFFPPDCTCSGYKEAKEFLRQQRENDPEHQEMLTPEQYNKKFPSVFKGERVVQDKDGSHKLKLEARKYDDGEGLCVWIPFPPMDGEDPEDAEGSGLCWDFTDKDAKALHELLTDYLEKK
jgi:hypothetical protein